MVHVTAINELVLTSRAKAFALPFKEVGIEVGINDIPLVGGKNVSLGEMLQELSPRGISVPDGFATTAYAYRYFIEIAGLEEKLRQLFAELDIEDVLSLRQVGKQARSLGKSTKNYCRLKLKKLRSKTYPGLVLAS